MKKGKKGTESRRWRSGVWERLIMLSQSVHERPITVHISRQVPKYLPCLNPSRHPSQSEKKECTRTSPTLKGKRRKKKKEIHITVPAMQLAPFSHNSSEICFFLSVLQGRTKMQCKSGDQVWKKQCLVIKPAVRVLAKQRLSDGGHSAVLEKMQPGGERIINIDLALATENYNTPGTGASS